jgi:hypothetical protein
VNNLRSEFAPLPEPDVLPGTTAASA